jgi:hypothetical protein
VHEECIRLPRLFGYLSALILSLFCFMFLCDVICLLFATSLDTELAGGRDVGEGRASIQRTSTVWRDERKSKIWSGAPKPQTAILVEYLCSPKGKGGKINVSE